MPGPVTCLPGRERGPGQGVMPRSRVLHTPCRLLPLHRGLVLLGGCQVRGWGVEMGCFLGHLPGLKKRSYSRKRNELNPCHLPARCGGMSHTGLELRKDVPAERGHVGAQAGCRHRSDPLLPGHVCPMCTEPPNGVCRAVHCGACQHVRWAHVASAWGCTQVCAASLCIPGERLPGDNPKPDLPA